MRYPSINKIKYLLFAVLCILYLTPGNAQTLGPLWGMTPVGGDSLGGTIFYYNAAAGTNTVVNSFPIPPKYPFYNNLIQTSDSNFYGMAASLGYPGSGTLFKCTPAGVLTVVHEFSGIATDGGTPEGSLILGIDGNFYGMTYAGGASGKGVIFKCSPTGQFSILHHFAGGASDGEAPYGSLIQASDSNFYGMTYQGGLYGYGTIFKCAPSGSMALLHSFKKDTSDGGLPHGSLIQASDGNLYGMTTAGGLFNNGVVFKCATAGTYQVVHHFAGYPSDGAAPDGDLLQAGNGKLYGMTSGGGTYGGGAILECSTGGTMSLMHSFRGNNTDGGQPHGNLIQGKDSLLYGMTYGGSSPFNGTVFSCSTGGLFSLMHVFNPGMTDGGNPYGSLIQARDGKLYGMTFAGGPISLGTIIRCTTSGSESLFALFGTNVYGYTPVGTPIKGNDGNLYGMTYLGGAYGEGTIFQYTSSGTMKVVHTFTGSSSDGMMPYGSLIQASDGNLYGMTLGGGTNNWGVIFKCSTTGNFSVLHSFTGGSADGEDPYGSLIQASDGNLYGMTQMGGYGGGIIFQCTTGGVLTVLHAFKEDSTDGGAPYGSLIQGTDGKLYGMTQYGGVAGNGVIFKCSTAGNFSLLHSFRGAPGDGDRPSGDLIQAGDGNFYGMSMFGGTSSQGVIFKCTPAGSVNILHNFSSGGNKAFSPGGSLIQASDGNLYGLAAGGTTLQGTLIECTTGGAESTLADLSGVSHTNAFVMGNLLEYFPAGIINHPAFNLPVTAFPNPANSAFNLSFGTVDPQQVTFSLMDAQGNCISNKTRFIHSQDQIPVDISMLSAGIYFLRISTDKGEQTLKFVKE
ncbi:MAG TPA: choice-of-anchor tandem repeat GloVer-containing protein [Bacteroidia bacterium]|jgi:uncharacterized repeat protein (TIGR03803 family)|nr:choice-of-anchor tandem repeat GloVer-containing protein [Bacteroidia bacterium]